MEKVGDKLVEANKNIIQNTHGHRAEKKANQGVEAYSQNDLRFIMKEIGAKISNRRVEGEVKDTYARAIGDVNGTYIMAVHTGSVLHRHEETLMANSKEGQFNFDDKQFAFFHNSLGYGFLPIKENELTKKHQEIVARLRSLMTKEEYIFLINPKTGDKSIEKHPLMVIAQDDGTLKFNVDHSQIPLGIGGIPKAVFYVVDRDIYRIDHKNSDGKKGKEGITFIRRGFKPALSNKFIGFVTSVPHDKNKPNCVVIDTHSSYITKSDKGFLLNFGLGIQGIAEKLLGKDGKPLIDYKAWLEENKGQIDNYSPKLKFKDTFEFNKKMADLILKNNSKTLSPEALKYLSGKLNELIGKGVIVAGVSPHAERPFYKLQLPKLSVIDFDFSCRDIDINLHGIAKITPKFKIGDKVGFVNLPNAKTATITHIDTSVGLKYAIGNGWWNEEELYLAKEDYIPKLKEGDTFLFKKEVADKASLTSDFVGKKFKVYSVITDYNEISKDQYPSLTTYNIKTSVGHVLIDCKIVDDSLFEENKELSENLFNQIVSKIKAEEVEFYKEPNAILVLERCVAGKKLVDFYKEYFEICYKPKLKVNGLFVFTKEVLKEFEGVNKGHDDKAFFESLKPYINHTFIVKDIKPLIDGKALYMVADSENKQMVAFPIDCESVDKHLSNTPHNLKGTTSPTLLQETGGFIFKESMRTLAKGTTNTDLARKDKGQVDNFEISINGKKLEFNETDSKTKLEFLERLKTSNSVIKVENSKGWSGNHTIYHCKLAINLHGYENVEIKIVASVFDKLIREGKEGEDFWITNAPLEVYKTKTTGDSEKPFIPFENSIDDFEVIETNIDFDIEFGGDNFKDLTATIDYKVYDKTPIDLVLGNKLNEIMQIRKNNFFRVKSSGLIILPSIAKRECFLFPTVKIIPNNYQGNPQIEITEVKWDKKTRLKKETIDILDGKNFNLIGTITRTINSGGFVKIITDSKNKIAGDYTNKEECDKSILDTYFNKKDNEIKKITSLDDLD